MAAAAAAIIIIIKKIRTLCTTPTPVYAGREHTDLNMIKAKLVKMSQHATHTFR
jgi:hypothetical protein